jgi:F-type H+-transporting ATPase subunit a
MNRVFFIILALSSTVAFASGGFTWLGPVSHLLNIPEHIVTLAFVSLFLLVTGFFYRKKIKKLQNVVIPDEGFTLRNICEAFGQFMYGQCKAVIGEKQGPKYFKFCGFIFIMILFSNLIGLIPGFLPPTENLNTTLALGFFTFVYYNIKGCKELGTINYLKHFAGPLWYMAVLIFPIEIISNCIRPISLALRLRGNMYGDHLVLGIFSGMVPALIPIVFMVLGLLVCFIQAYVFTVLTMVYIALATAHHDHGDHEAHAHH